ncbi:Hypothetical protein R9X50_00442000 [Acrodontium crateriforme]|uniref:Uncharacterized protein n=1 Tax=Acrodontium crateriforme TaxID=150365 RepID=A0AAQ3M4A6_9PEZI|nr:Hypothetical protein R9X50_00442000 [Acrodontium crateriforme]
MKKSFSARRVPRQIGQDDETIAAPNTPATEQSEPIFKRATTKNRKSASVRTSFGPSIVHDEEDGVEPSGVVTPKRSTISRLAIQRNASKKASLLSVSKLPPRDLDDDDDSRPDYTAEGLQLLKDSTPSTPRDLTTTTSDVEDVSSGTQALDLSSKFGSSLARYQQSAIPSATEIAEKKARRARMAKEQQAEEYISLNPDDANLDADDDEEDLDDNVMRDDLGRLVLKPKDKYNQAETRLVRDDEDVMEGFDAFTSDGTMALGRKAEIEAARKKKIDMAAQIAEAQGINSDSDDASDSSEKLRNEAFEAAQTRHGTYAAKTGISSEEHAHLRPKTPPKISPLPTLDGAILTLKEKLAEMEISHSSKMRMMDELQREKIGFGEDEIRIQKALRETAEKFRLIKLDKRIESSSPGMQAIEAPRELHAVINPAPESAEVSEGDVNDVEERPGLGSGGAGAGLGFGARGFSETGTPGMPRGESDEE